MHRESVVAVPHLDYLLLMGSLMLEGNDQNGSSCERSNPRTSDGALMLEGNDQNGSSCERSNPRTSDGA
eukprot:c42404_g1_i1 orf=174-380(+)